MPASAEREELHRLFRAHGPLTPELVAASAADPRSPLHHRMCVGGPACVVEQARSILEGTE